MKKKKMKKIALFLSIVNKLVWFLVFWWAVCVCMCEEAHMHAKSNELSEHLSLTSWSAFLSGTLLFCSIRITFLAPATTAASIRKRCKSSSMRSSSDVSNSRPPLSPFSSVTYAQWNRRENTHHSMNNRPKQKLPKIHHSIWLRWLPFSMSTAANGPLTFHTGSKGLHCIAVCIEQYKSDMHASTFVSTEWKSRGHPNWFMANAFFLLLLLLNRFNTYLSGLSVAAHFQYSQF